MVLLPVRKCYYMAKVCAVVGLVVTVLGMFEYWRGGRRSVRATAPEFSDAESAEFERQIRADEARIIPGLGEGGAAAELSGEAKRLGDESVKKNAVNVYLSDRISYTRSLADLRHPACNNVVYDAELPSASVILIFHNEPYSVVVRTIWSVINSARRDHDFHQRANFRHSSGRTMKLGYPGQEESSPFVYLKELILVDDNSTLLELKGKLSYYVRTRLPPDLVKILRLPQRVGLTRARLAGARRAAGDVLVFLDAHCEAQRDWLRPLLQRIGDSRTAVVMPVIDVVEATNFYYSVADPADFEIGGFSFNGHFQWIDVPERERQRRGSPVGATWSPTMAGGLFAIERNYFWELGAYDEQMGGWGGENLEISFRIWMCGGTLETVPCSRVGHVFRSFHPYGLPASSDTHGINTARMAEVWMDDYKELFYLHRPDLRKNPKVGDVTHRKVLREKLHCKDFQWYLDTVYPQKFVPVRDTFGYGRFQNPSSGMCLDNLQHDSDHDPLGVYPCHSTISESQYYALSYSGELRTENGCADVKHSRLDRERSAVEDDAQRTVVMAPCRARRRPTPTWQYLPTKQLLHVASGLCLEASPVPSSHAHVTRCRDAPAQTWRIDYSELNHFQRDNDLISREQEEALSKIRTSRNLTRSRISRSLMAYEGEEKDNLEALSETESSGPEGGTGGEDVPASAPAPDPTTTTAPAPVPSRRHIKHKHKKAKKHGKAKRSRPKTKNMFILKLVRTLMNNTEEHLEVKIQCKHRRLFPNNTFVRDLVTILNEKNIKVINNGRVFERNRVTELAPRKRPKKVLEKLDIGASPVAPPAPEAPAPQPPAQHPPVLRHLPQQRPSASNLDVAQQTVPELAPLALAPFALAPPAALASARDELLDGRAGDKPSRAPPPVPHAVLAPPAQPPQRPPRPAPPPPQQQRHDDFEKRIIVEDFVEVRPKSPAPVATQPSNSPLARASKKRRRKPIQALPSPPPTASPTEATPPQNIDVRPLQQGAGQSDRGSSGVKAGAGELVYKQAQEAPAYGPDQELAAGKQLLITLFNHNKPHRELDEIQPASMRDGVLETAAATAQRARAGDSADTDVSAERNSVGGSDGEVYDAAEYVVPSQSEDEASREAPPAPPELPYLPEPDLDGGEVSARRDSQSTSPFEEDAVLTGGGVLARPTVDVPVARARARPPLKVVMRSNLTFNLGDEFFKWRSRDDDLTSLLGELSIPTNSSMDAQHAAPRAKPRPAVPRSPALAAPHKLLKAVLSSSTDNEDSSSSDSSSAGT